jgi:hypothetical protein
MSLEIQNVTSLHAGNKVMIHTEFTSYIIFIACHGKLDYLEVRL